MPSSTTDPLAVLAYRPFRLEQVKQASCGFSCVTVRTADGRTWTEPAYSPEELLCVFDGGNPRKHLGAGSVAA